MPLATKLVFQKKQDPFEEALEKLEKQRISLQEETLRLQEKLHLPPEEQKRREARFLHHKKNIPVKENNPQSQALLKRQQKKARNQFIFLCLFALVLIILIYRTFF